MTTTALPAGFDPTDPDIYVDGVPHEEFLALRRSAPLHWVEQPPEARAGQLGTGYWAVSRHADVAAVSKNSKDFSSYENGAIIRFGPDVGREDVEMQRVMLINQDPPDHTKLRQIISRGFTPRSIGGLREHLAARAQRIIGEVKERGGQGNFVDDIASELPLQAIAELLGVPLEDRKKLFDWSNAMMSFDDPEYEGDPQVASIEILGYFMAMAEERKLEPKDDIVTKLIQSDRDGAGALGSDEFGYFTLMLTVAGNETTRNAITHGMNAFLDHPEQWELYKRDRPASAVDEIIRWATPVTVFQRTALTDVEVGGQLVKKGERVGLFYASANHDDDVFIDPGTFDITRSPNPHLAFGGHGAHYCIGANLARLEIDLIFAALADQLPDLQKVAEPRRLRHGWINGIKDLQVSYD